MSYSLPFSKFCKMLFPEYVSEGISHPVFYGDLICKLRMVKGAVNFVSFGLKYNAFNVKSMTQWSSRGLYVWFFYPSTALYISYLERCSLANKTVGTIWRNLSKPPQRRQYPGPRPFWLLVGTPSALWPEIARSEAYYRGCQYTYFWYVLRCLCSFLLPLRLGWSSVTIRRIIYKF